MQADYSPAPDLLKERVIAVTGAGSGFGQAAAKAYAAHGATVILLGRTLSKLEETYDAIEAAGGAQPAIFPINLESLTEQEYYALSETIYKEFNRLDGLLHCAAQLALLSRIDDYDLETWNKVMQVNLTAPFMLTQVCLPLLKRADDASIIFTSDQVGRKGKAYWGAYGVSKFGVEGLMQILAEETENSPLRVNSIAPGAARTALRAWAYPGEDPQDRPLPEAFMRPFLYLMGPDSAGVTGQAFDAQAEKL
ncbi:YciK family oxidoreductase [endosymbiont of Ridgeia piscesae]|jgi:NAD(P)-dependent dehydrogenase (short-subunit alcohol dehydrogenase family)|uniref:NAD(P)-dependent dehydrogenase n=1 Tax=endosymbiont of Ridgeia piscesae TaxID=54398 RepID=A0A0T5YZN9_9GAMM|nr:YciK family oxidoreductase [endosymbiont of Ridgeia piscesae]KRT56119.1 NAD(P)-dependent dehydrogenase, short-chain alcohol dehydrogenase family [endosymbiont of Ridgeia piscesae]KRT57713.1 NAD(P)-dependent dehydrogenase [endosymbiont of Ridgeia piscesae]